MPLLALAMDALVLADGVLGQLFVRPIPLPPWLRLWMIVPLLLCVSLVYRATRSRSVSELPRSTVLTFVNILLGMIAIAVGAYIVHRLVLWLT